MLSRRASAILAALGCAASLAVLPAHCRVRRQRPGQPAVGPGHDGRARRLAGDPGRRRRRRGDRQRGVPVRQRPGRIGPHRPRLHRHQHPAVQSGLGRARHLDGVADRPPRARARRRQRGHRRRAAVDDPVHPGHPGPRRPALPAVRARAGAERPGLAGPGHRLRGTARRQGDQHVDRLQRAERGGQAGAAGGLLPRRGGGRFGGELRGPGGDERRRPGAGVLPGRLPGRDQRGGREHGREGGQLLQRKPVRPGGRAWFVLAPRAGTGSTGGSAAPARPARWWPGWRP